MRQPRHFHTRFVQKIGDVVGGRLAVDGGVHREDHLAHAALAHAVHQALDVEVLRADAVERRQRAAEDMVLRIDRPGALQRPEVGDILDHDDDAAVAARIRATTGLGKVIMDPRFGKIADDIYQSSDFDNATHKVEITAKSGAGNVSINS